MIVGAAVGIAGLGAGLGAALALADVHSPLRAPFTLFFLLAAPALAIGSALRGLDALARPVLAVPDTLALDLLVAEAMLALRMWSARGGVAAVGAVSLLILVPTLLTRLARRPASAPKGRVAVEGESRAGSEGRDSWWRAGAMRRSSGCGRARWRRWSTSTPMTSRPYGCCG
ncbi:hypothetical protein M271_37910 [Streptomyces rapamycinicus NRRL 5491]|nr:hypothetical protein M271_37910 [Streptomyces rapamycinicus NRRL 5491]